MFHLHTVWDGLYISRTRRAIHSEVRFKILSGGSPQEDLLMLAVLIALCTAMQFTKQEQLDFVRWMKENGVVYTGAEFYFRLGIFVINGIYVMTHNKINSEYKVKLNQFACYTKTEYSALLGFRPNFQRFRTKSEDLIEKVDSEPFQYDWRNEGAVTPVKYQGSCGSCWAFSTTAACESSYKRKSGLLFSFSESNLVDCVTSCFGCSGGMMSDAVNYIVSRQGGNLMAESDYPYQPAQGPCRFDASKATGHVSRYINVAMYDEQDLMHKCYNHGVVACALDAQHESFQLYSSGIYSEATCSTTYVNHGVDVVGWGVAGTVKYWIVRNCWGTKWGEDGYMRLKKDAGNMCGIAAMALVVVSD